MKATEDAIASAKKALEGGIAEEMKSASEKLLAASHKVAEILYKQASTSEGGEAAPGGENTVVDAEVVDDKKSGASDKQ